MSSNDTTPPTRPDMSVLKDSDPTSPGVLCLDGAYLNQLVAYVEHLERATGMQRDYSILPDTVSVPYLIVKVMEDHVGRGMSCICGTPIGDSIDMRWHLANRIEDALKQRGALS